MGPSHKPELDRLFHQLNATLTPKQRQALVVGALQADMMTPAQIEIMKRMESYLQGLTPQQCRQLGMVDTFREEYDRGRKSGNVIAIWFSVGAILLMIAIILTATLR